MVLKKLQASVGNAFEIPQDVLLDVPKCTLVGNMQIWIENHTGLVEYTPEKVRLNTNIGVLTLSGSGFVLVELLPTELKLEGKLSRMEFGEG